MCTSYEKWLTRIFLKLKFKEFSKKSSDKCFLKGNTGWNFEWHFVETDFITNDFLRRTNMMLQESGTSEKSSSNVTIFENGFEDITSLEEADCFLEFLSQEYPGNGKIFSLLSYSISLFCKQ